MAKSGPNEDKSASARIDDRIAPKAVYEAAPVGIFRADLEKRLTYANKRLCAFANRTLDELLASGWMEGLSPGQRQLIEQKWNAAQADCKPWDMSNRSAPCPRCLSTA